MATIERDGAPWLTIDCGSEGLTAYLDHYGEPPRAIFVTHVHLDHVGGFERLFVIGAGTRQLFHARGVQRCHVRQKLDDDGAVF